MDRVGPGVWFFCPSSIGCVGYQRFHAGYIWERARAGVQAPVACPDVYPYYPNQDYSVDIDDITAVAGAFLQADTGLAPYSPWLQSFYDLDGDGAIIIDDISIVAESFLVACLPPS